MLNMHESTNTTNIVSSLNEDLGSILEFNNSINITSLKVKFHSVVLLDIWVWVADGSAVVSHNVWDFVLSKLLLDNLQKLEFSLRSFNTDWLEASLDIIKDTEILV